MRFLNSVFLINWKYPDPDSHPIIFSSSVAISPSYWPFKKKSACIKHGSFWISMFQYTDIFESPCIETRRFKKVCVLYMEIFETPCIETWRFKNMNSFASQNLHVSIHGDFWISVYWNMEIQKSPCLNHGDFWISMYWNTEIQKSPCFRTRR